MNQYKKFLLITQISLFYGFTSFGQIDVKAVTDTIGRYNVYELTIHHPKSYANNCDDVVIEATFNGPETVTVNGFFFDNNTWKVRFAPRQVGDWTYAINFKTPTTSYTSTGKFICIASDTKGFLTRHPHNPFRLIHPDGTLFNGIGLEDCMLDFDGNGSPINDWGIDGGLTDPPATFIKGNRTTLQDYMNKYGVNGARFNLFRWSTDNCSFKLYDSIEASGNNYGIQEGKWGDTLVRSLRDNQLRLYLVFFGPPVFSNINGSTPLEEAAIKRYVNYVVARYGAYADIWELFNENYASDYYINTITSYIRSIDPYKRLISISDEQPQKAAIDITSPHWYEKESELESDQRAWDRIIPLKKWNKPIIFGEQGNSVQNWDPLSAERMRIRSWTAFFAEGMFVFWNTSMLKNYLHQSANIYLGPQERGYIRAMQDFTAQADSAVKPIDIIPDNTYDVRAYGLRSSKVVMGYFHHFTSHTTFTSTHFKYRMRQNGTLYWINPADNMVIDSARIYYGNQTITTPAFNTDIAMLIKLDQGPLIFDVSKKLDVIAYPNPASTEFYIDGNFNGGALVELYDQQGRKVFRQGNVTINQRLNSNGLAPGLYFYKVLADERQATGKLIIQ